MSRFLVAVVVLTWVALAAGCGDGGGGDDGPVFGVVASHSLDDLDGLIDHDEEMSIDPVLFTEGSGSLLIKAREKRTVRLIELIEPAVENAMLICSAQVKTANFWGKAYLDLRCQFPDGVARSNRAPASFSRTENWRPVGVTYPLEAGRRPLQIVVVLVLEGAGNIWIDDLKLTAEPLPG